MTNQQAGEQMPATVRVWTDILARIRFGTVHLAGKNVAGSRIKLVAGRLATYADGDGTRVRPGIARLAVDLELDYRSVGPIVAYLRRLGLLGMVKAGKGVRADEYRLTLPVNLLERDDLTVWSPTRQTTEIEQVRAARRGVRHRTPQGDPDGPDGIEPRLPEGDAHQPDARLPEGDAQTNSATPSGSGDATPSGVPKSASATPSGGRARLPQGVATHQDLDTTTTNHADEDLRTAVTGPRATGPATKPPRCPHGLKPTRRADGRPSCALCRVAEDRPATQHPPPLATDHLAPVIDLHTREAS